MWSSHQTEEGARLELHSQIYIETRKHSTGFPRSSFQRLSPRKVKSPIWQWCRWIVTLDDVTLRRALQWFVLVETTLGQRQIKRLWSSDFHWTDSLQQSGIHTCTKPLASAKHVSSQRQNFIPKDGDEVKIWSTVAPPVDFALRRRTRRSQWQSREASQLATSFRDGRNYSHEICVSTMHLMSWVLGLHPNKKIIGRIPPDTRQ